MDDTKCAPSSFEKLCHPLHKSIDGWHIVPTHAPPIFLPLLLPRQCDSRRRPPVGFIELQASKNMWFLHSVTVCLVSGVQKRSGPKIRLKLTYVHPSAISVPSSRKEAGCIFFRKLEAYECLRQNFSEIRVKLLDRLHFFIVPSKFRTTKGDDTVIFDAALYLT